MFLPRLLSSIAVLLCIGVASAATTTPLGIYAVKIAGAEAGVGPARTYVGVPLVQKPIIMAAVGPVNGNRFSFPGLQELQGKPGKEYYVHVMSGPGQGYIAEVTGFEGPDIVCSADLTEWMAPGVQVAIRPHHSLADLFGADNRFGFTGGEDASLADKIVTWDALVQRERVYYFNTLRARWEEKDVAEDASNAKIRYPNGLYVVRLSPDPMRIALSGETSHFPVLLPVRPGANVFSLPLNLSSSIPNLVETSGTFAVKGGEHAAQADILNFHEPTTGARLGPFFYRNTFNDSGWCEVGVYQSHELMEAPDWLSTLVLRRNGEAGYVRVKGSIIVPPQGIPPISPDPWVGELPLEVEVPSTGPYPSDVVIKLEKSANLRDWTEIAYEQRPDRRVIFNLPPGESRAFYRLNVSLGNP